MLAASSSAADGYATSWWPFLSMLVLLAVIGVVVWGVTLIWTTWVMHRPPRMTAGRAMARLGRAFPPDVGLAEYIEERYEVGPRGREGRTELAAWWVSHPAGDAVHRTCILLHGYGDSRAGSLAWAPLWRDLGFHLLLLDTRGHGDSGGRYSGGGVWERDDLCDVVDELRRRHPGGCRQVVLFGVSFGGMIAAATAAWREDITALVVDSPVDGWGTATRRYGELIGLPLDRAHALRLRLAEWRLGVRFDEVRPRVTLPRVRCPILAIIPREDVLVAADERAEMARIVESKGPPSRAWWAESTHNLALAADPGEYERQVRAFLEAAV